MRYDSLGAEMGLVYALCERLMVSVPFVFLIYISHRMTTLIDFEGES